MHRMADHRDSWPPTEVINNAATNVPVPATSHVPRCPDSKISVDVCKISVDFERRPSKKNPWFEAKQKKTLNFQPSNKMAEVFQL